MSSDFIASEQSFYSNYNPHLNPIDMFNSDSFLQSDNFSNLSDPSFKSILEEISEEPNPNPITPEARSKLDQLAHTLLSDSSPTHQMENLSLYQQTHFNNLQNSSDFSNGLVDCSVLGVKLEEAPFQSGFDSCSSSNAYFSGNESYAADNSMIKFLPRSFSDGSSLFDDNKQGCLLQPEFTPAHSTDSSVNSYLNFQFGGQIRRVFSTGDLQKKTTQRESASHLRNQRSINTTFIEDTSYKVGKYSPEERKEKIEKYRAKRSLRNFNKTIKYACRKTLADSRPRVRGRFARNDEPVEIVKSIPRFNRYEDEDDLWVEALHAGDGNQRGQFVNNFGSSFQFDNEFIGY